MAIRTVVTRGYGTGSFAGARRLLPVRGYDAATAVSIAQSVRPRLFVARNGKPARYWKGRAS